eukprot:INCI10708.1.p2 GENE.INCI10708.1~~INCI10708.1.p2  ORF type:complete len:260 (+),score=46.28 INCI10708.1:97-876(+)
MSSSQVQRRHRLSSLGLNRLLSIAKEAGAQVTQTMAGSDIVDAIIAVEEQNEWRDAFAYHAIYSTDSDPEDRHIPEHLPIQLLPRVVRALGQTPNPAELEEIEQLADPDSRGFFAFGDLVKAMDFLKTRVHDSQDLIAAFETMSEGGVPGKIKYDVLREKMRRAGLSPQELDQMVKDGDPDPQGLIDYNEFIQRMLAVRNQSITRPPLPANPTVDEIRNFLKQPRSGADGSVYTIEDSIKYRYPYKTTAEIIADLTATD